MKKTRLLTWVLSAVLAAGCATKSPAPRAGHAPATLGARPDAAQKGTPVIEPEPVLVGRIIRVAPTAQFVLIRFPLGCLPAPEQLLHVYRDGKKVGELKATRLMLDELAIADVLSGECRPGDEVADR